MSSKVITGEESILLLTFINMSSENSDQMKEAELKEAFAMFDKDSDGTITLKELATTLSLLGINPSEEELLVMFNSVDVDTNGVIDYEEFKLLMKQHLRDEPMTEEQEFRRHSRHSIGMVMVRLMQRS